MHWDWGELISGVIGVLLGWLAKHFSTPPTQK
jgi:F0F1-type ATP synthase assembly protein I